MAWNVPAGGFCRCSCEDPNTGKPQQYGFMIYNMYVYTAPNQRPQNMHQTLQIPLNSAPSCVCFFCWGGYYLYIYIYYIYIYIHTWNPSLTLFWMEGKGSLLLASTTQKRRTNMFHVYIHIHVNGFISCCFFMFHLQSRSVMTILEKNFNKSKTRVFILPFLTEKGHPTLSSTHPTRTMERWLVEPSWV